MESGVGSSSNSIVCCDYDATTDNNHFDYDPADSPCKVRIHRMPFQRRTLSYWTGIRYGSRRVVRNKKHIHIGKRHHQATTKTGTTTTTKTKHQKLDLLNTLWQHRVRNYNDAFLSSPRRNTRNYYAKVNTPPLPALPSSVNKATQMRSPVSDKKEQPKTTTTTTRRITWS